MPPPVIRIRWPFIRPGLNIRSSGVMGASPPFGLTWAKPSRASVKGGSPRLAGRPNSCYTASLRLDRDTRRPAMPAIILAAVLAATPAGPSATAKPAAAPTPWSGTTADDGSVPGQEAGRPAARLSDARGACAKPAAATSPRCGLPPARGGTCNSAPRRPRTQPAGRAPSPPPPR